MTDSPGTVTPTDRGDSPPGHRSEQERVSDIERVAVHDNLLKVISGDPYAVDGVLGDAFDNLFEVDTHVQMPGGRSLAGPGLVKKFLRKIVYVAYQHRVPAFVVEADVRNWLLAVARVVVTEVGRPRATEEATAETSKLPSPDPGRSSDRLVLEYVREIVAWLHWGRRPPIGVPTGTDFAVDRVIGCLGIQVGQSSGSTNREFFDRADRVIGAFLLARIGNSRCSQLERIRQPWNGSFDSDFRNRVIDHVDGCATCNEQRRHILLSSFGRRSRLSLAGLTAPIPATAGLLDSIHGGRLLPGDDRDRGKARRDSGDPPPGAADLPSGNKSRNRRWKRGRIAPEGLLPFAVMAIILLLLLGGSSAVGRPGVNVATSSGTSADPDPTPTSSPTAAPSPEPSPSRTDTPPLLRLSAVVIDLGSTTTSGSVIVFNDGGTPSNVSVNNVPRWMHVVGPGGEVGPNGSGQLDVSVDRGAAPPGQFEARLSIKPVAGGDGAELFVIGNGAKPPAAFSVSAGTIDLGSTNNKGSVTIHNDGGRPSGVIVTGQPAWLHVSRPTGEIPPGGSAALTVTIDRAAAPVGPFTQSLRIGPVAGGKGADLLVVGNGAKPPAAFSVSVGTIDLGSTNNKGSVTIRNDGGRPSGVAVTGQPTWLHVTPPTGEIQPGGSASLTVAVDRTAASVGPFQARLSINPSAGGGGATLTIRGSVDPPTARLTVTPISGRTPLPVQANASTSSPGSAPPASAGNWSRPRSHMAAAATGR